VREYETVFILHSQVDEAGIDRNIEAVKQTIVDGKGEVAGVYKWGRRRLAYQIRKSNDGFYTLIRFKAEPAVLRELDRRFNINESVLRFQTTLAVGDPAAPDFRGRERRPERGRMRGDDRHGDDFSGGFDDGDRLGDDGPGDEDTRARR
jgi:small subunit ribosomal protein S6